MYSGSWKQKMVTRSSAESEVGERGGGGGGGGGDVLPQMLWMKKFLGDQGVDMKETILYNGKQSSMKRTKHMDIWYFYVTERVENKTLMVKYCPMEDMIAAYFTNHYKDHYSLNFTISSWE